jgi:hypothetical protein
MSTILIRPRRNPARARLARNLAKAYHVRIVLWSDRERRHPEAGGTIVSRQNAVKDRHTNFK